MRRNLALFIVLLLLMLCGCEKLAVPTFKSNDMTYTGGERIQLDWDAVENGTSYKVSFYIYPLSEGRLARAIELTDTHWEGVMSAGKYDVVVQAKDGSRLGEASSKITLSVESDSMPNRDDISFFFASAHNQANSKLGASASESDTGTAVIDSYDHPVIDLTCDHSKPSRCSQITIYDENFILLSTSTGKNTQAELLLRLTENHVAYENKVEETDAHANRMTVFAYNNYDFCVNLDADDYISYLTIRN